VDDPAGPTAAPADPLTHVDDLHEAVADVEREVLTWTQFGVASRALAQAVADSGFRPDIILAIARGGLTVAGALGYALGIKNCFAISVEYYTGIDERLDVPVVLPPMPDLVAVRDLNVLIADDVADTGDTLSMVERIIHPHVREARSAVLYKKSRSVIEPTYTWRQTDAWITFPWSADEPIAMADPA
jgi:hypoxanthine phosphoribosyltransferase